MWDALLANLDDEDRAHAERRVFESIEEDRNKALSVQSDERFDSEAETADSS